MPSLAPPAELLRALSQVLTDLRAGWYVLDAQVVMHWGRPRLTGDIDVTVQLGAVDMDRLITELQRAGFSLRQEGTPPSSTGPAWCRLCSETPAGRSTS